MYNLRQFSLIYDMYRNGFLYPTPANLTIHWNFGFLAGIVLFLQIISGILLVFWYIPSVSAAFNSIDYIMRDVNFGWFIRYIHANGASLFFAIIYIHIGRGIYYGSYTYPREIVWVSGMFIFVIMILTAFFGYVLPWGQMSYWAATVISSLLSVIPIFGDILLIYVWGGINIDQPTLTRIFGLHYVLPFILLAFVILHIIFLHEHGSNNPVGINTNDHIFFNSYYTIKDMYSFLILLLAYTFFVFFQPDLSGHSDNYIMADAGVTPSHTVPEWYFLQQQYRLQIFYV